MRDHPRVLPMLASGLALAAALALVAVLAGTVLAQSGRRAPKSAPAPTPTPQDLPVEKKPAQEATFSRSFIVGIDRVGHFTNIPSYFYDSVLRACADRLDNAPSVKAEIAHRDMNRAEAVKRAKAESEASIVWIQMRFDSARAESGNDFSEVYLEYWVFAPTTAKMITNGRSYQQAYRTGGVIMLPRPSGRASLPYSEQMLKQAARDAAERILAVAEAPPPRRDPPR
jgi:hypothetical protein